MRTIAPIRTGPIGPVPLGQKFSRSENFLPHGRRPPVSPEGANCPRVAPKGPPEPYAKIQKPTLMSSIRCARLEGATTSSLEDIATFRFQGIRGDPYVIFFWKI